MMNQRDHTSLTKQVPDTIMYAMICIALWIILLFLFSCISSLELFHINEVQIQFTPLCAAELLISSIGLTYASYCITNKKAFAESNCLNNHNALLVFCLCFFIAMVLECSLFQYNHYGSLFIDDSSVTGSKDKKTEWNTLRFAQFPVNEQAGLSESFYFSLADLPQETDEDEQRIKYINKNLVKPKNSIDEEYEKNIDEYEKSRQNGIKKYPKPTSYDEEMAVVSFPSFNKKIHSIHITPFFLPGNNNITGKATHQIDVMVCYSDEDNTLRKTEVFSIIEGQKYTEYIPIYPVGKVSEINICFCNQGAAFSDISFNEIIPLDPVLLRILLVAGMLFAILLLGKNRIYYPPFNAGNRRQNIGFAVLLSVLLAYCIFMTYTAVQFDYEPGSSGQYNHYLIDALLHGRVDLDIPTSEKYAALTRHYDRGQFELYGIDYLGKEVHWDTVYYNGKWYSYFGIVPAVLLFLPYTAVTGRYLPYSAACLLMGFLSIVFLLLIWRVFFKTYLNKASFITYILSSAALAMCSFVPFLQHRSFFYETVNLGGLMLCSAGMYLLLQYKDKKRILLLFLSCLCFALAVGCRPILLLVSVFVPVILWQDIKERWNEEKGSAIVWIMSLSIPYIAVAIPLMWYNYARFGSVFEFGLNYQVTGLNIGVQNLMNPIGQLQRFITGILGYFFNPPLLLLQFPFIQVQKVPVSNSAYIPQYLGAVGLFTVPVTWLLLAYIKADKSMQKKEPIIQRFIISSIIVSALTAGLSSKYCIQPRYEIDYAWLILLSALFCLYYIYNKNYDSDIQIRKIDKIVSGICLISIVMFFFLNFRGEIDPEYAIRPVAVEAYLKRAFSLFGGI